MPYLARTENGTSIKVFLAPRSSVTRIIGLHGDELKIAVCAPPVEGAANESLIKFLSKLLKVSKSSFEISSGEHSRHKVIQVRGLAPEAIAQALQAG